MTPATDRPVPDLNNTAEREYALRRAIDGLREDDPIRSASVSLVPWQRMLIWTTLAIVLGCAIWWPLSTTVVLVAMCTGAYLLTMADRVLIFREGLASRAIVISDAQARALPYDELPRYTICLLYTSPSPRD